MVRQAHSSCAPNTIGPRPALPSPHTHNQLGHLEYGALDLPRVHKTTYAPVIYTPLCIMF
jgi:hypothetical protein